MNATSNENVFLIYIEIFHNNTCILIISFTIPLVPQHLVRERLVFFLDLFYFQSIENSVDNFVGTERDRKRKHIKNESCPTTFLRQSREFLAGKMGATPHISFCPSFLSKAKLFFFFCTSKGVIYRLAYDEYSNRHAPDYIFKNGIATRYGGNIKDLS